MHFYGEILWELYGLSIYIFEFKQDGAVRKCLVSDKEKGRILKIGTGLLVLGI